MVFLEKKEPENILITGRLGEEFADYLTSEIGIRNTFVQNIANSQVDLSNFDAYAGFGSDLNHLDLSRIKWVHSFGAGIDNLVNHKSLPNEALISRTRGKLGLRIAEYCLTYITLILKNTQKLLANQNNQIWEQIEVRDLIDQKLLIYGTGHVGTAIAHFFKPLVSNIAGVNFSGKNSSEFDVIYQKDIPKKEALPYGIVINTLPLTHNTDNFFNKELFSKFSHTIFINVGRGKSVNNLDLKFAIKEGNIRKAVLDVFHKEPLTSDSSLWNHEDIIITPHQAGITTIDDVKQSFNAAWEAITRQEYKDLFTNKLKGY